MMQSSVEEFIRVAGQCGRGYMVSSGPTSRLEEKIIQAGQTHGLTTEVYATPTALFISAKQEGQVTTSLECIKDNEINFTDMLYFDGLLRLLSESRESMELVQQKLKQYRPHKYPFYQLTLSAFVIGFLASFNKYGVLLGGVMSGIITALIFILSLPLGGKLKFSGVFTDFFSCLISFLISIGLASLFKLPAPIFAMGSLVLIVPGLTLTSAISELAEHNFVSGTVKLVKAILIIVAMGVAYFIIENFSLLLTFHPMEMSLPGPSYSFLNNYFIKMMGRVILIFCFCIFFHLPLKALPGAIFCGLLSLIVLDQFTNPQLFVLASFLTSLTVGLVSLILGRLYRWPSQVFSTPGILSLVPGLVALSIFYDVGGVSPAATPGYRVALTAGAIVFGLFSARMPFRVYGALGQKDYHPERF